MRNQNSDLKKVEKFLKSNKIAYDLKSENGITPEILIKFDDNGKAEKYKKPKNVYTGPIMGEDDTCDACEELLEDDERGRSYEAYVEGYHVCPLGKKRKS